MFWSNLVLFVLICFNCSLTVSIRCNHTIETYFLMFLFVISLVLLILLFIIIVIINFLSFVYLVKHFLFVSILLCFDVRHFFQPLSE